MRFAYIASILTSVSSAAATALPVTVPIEGSFISDLTELAPHQARAISLDKRAHDYYYQGVIMTLALATSQRLIIRWLYDATQASFFNNGFDGTDAFQVNLFDNGPTSDQMVLRGGVVAQDRRTGITITSNDRVPIGDLELASGQQPGPQPTPWRATARTTHLDLNNGSPFTVRDTHGNAIRITSATLDVTTIGHVNTNNPPNPPPDEL